ncbi:MAG: ABC-2 family transporter protein [Gemmatimonadetes bacterium]|nr:ABC-2 family transporter protein [Gemmatimonadota bacterium]
MLPAVPARVRQPPQARGPDRRPSALRDWLTRYAALIRSAWLVDLQYRAEIVIWMVLGVAQPLVTLAIWWVLAGSGELGGYDRADFARYFFALMLVDQLTLAWDVWYIDRWIREGEMNVRLTRPFNPIHEAIGDNVAYKLRTGTAIALVWLLVALFWPAVRVPVDAGRWALAGTAVVLAAGLRFLTSYVNGLLAFWTTRATALAELHYGVSLFLAGRIAPLALLPPAVAAVAGVLWFPYMVAFPVEVLTGEVSGAGLVRGFGGQLFWLSAWITLYRLVWSRGIRRYCAVGG